MTAYYKATTADGTSFGAPEITWRVGSITRDPLPAPSGTGLCAEGLLRAATVPTETLVSRDTIDIREGWRLFEVAPYDSLVTSEHYPDRVGCRAWMVLAELPKSLALGPQGSQVMEIIDRAGVLTSQELAQFETEQASTRYEAREEVRANGHSAAAYARRQSAWTAAWDAAEGAVRTALPVAPCPYHDRLDATEAARDAVLALVTWDLWHGDRGREMRDLLIAPWAEVIGLPEGLGC